MIVSYNQNERLFFCCIIILLVVQYRRDVFDERWTGDGVVSTGKGFWRFFYEQNRKQYLIIFSYRVLGSLTRFFEKLAVRSVNIRIPDDDLWDCGCFDDGSVF